MATDLRVLVTTLHLVADLERMGDLALHVAKVARMRYPDIAVPAELRDVISQMGAVALSLVEQGRRGDQGPRRRAGPGDRGRGRLDGRAAPQAVHPVAVANWTHGTEAAIDMTLLGRYYERYADHAVAVARRTSSSSPAKCRPASAGTMPAERTPPAQAALPWLATASMRPRRGLRVEVLARP